MNINNQNSFLASGLVGSIEKDGLQKLKGQVQERWEKLGFCDGLDGYIKENMATLYENEAKHILFEATDSSNSGSFETVVFPIIRRVFSKLLANEIVSVQAMNLPIGKLFFIKPRTSERNWIRYDEDDINDGDTGSHVGLFGYNRANRNYDPNLVENKGQLGSRYSKTQAGTASATAPGNPEQNWDKTTDMRENLDYRTTENYNRYYLPDEVVQPADPKDPPVNTYMTKTLYDLFYNDYLFDQSKGKVTIKVGGANPVTLRVDGEYQDFTGQIKDFPSHNDATIHNILLKVTGFSSYNAGRLTGPDGNEMDTEEFLASMKVLAVKPITPTSGVVAEKFASFKAFEGIPYRVMTQKYGTGLVDYKSICDAKGAVYIELDLTKPIQLQGSAQEGYVGVQPDSLGTNSGEAGIKELFKVVWAQYDSLELETEIAEVSFTLDSVVVSVTERKLRATWSPEMAQDVAAFHNIDAEAELTSILSEQVAAEVDREILRDLRKYGAWRLRWNYYGWKVLNVTSTNYTQKDWNQTLVTAINQISAQIQKSTLRGGANWLVVSPEISAVFNDLEYFHVTDASAESDKYALGIEKIGSLGGRYQVVVDPYAPAWSLIMGHKGDSLLDTGYVYAPYIPLAITPTMYNVNNMAPVKMLMTRYAKKLISNKFYGTIQVDNLVQWNPNELR
ncbi:hypothetical protein EZS27_013980 [termite gut metagenome]|uniref:Major capsid protein n=1 Tax=termite gut metagenome TaxID=433724 RepID=A0A5J4RWZ6_9ZZZZ